LPVRIIRWPTEKRAVAAGLVMVGVGGVLPASISNSAVAARFLESRTVRIAV
jgi:hypothetical protein